MVRMVRSAEKIRVAGYWTAVLLALYRITLVPAIRVVGSTGLLKTTRIAAFVPTPVWLAGGSVELMTGPVVSEVEPVVKVKLPGLLSALPAASVSWAP